MSLSMLSANFGGCRCQFTTTLTVAILLTLDNGVQAQITADQSTNTQVQTKPDLTVITGGIQAGKNLFHSFQEFSIDTDEVAKFDHAQEIETIFSRITGGEVSEIDGLIKTQGETSLFLLNPAGVIFGANAQLDLGGSLIVTTGDRLIFADGTEFSAIAPKTDPLLTISAPIGIQYGDSGTIKVLPNQNRISANSGLNIAPGNTFALLGGDVSLSRNSVNAINSNLEIAGVKSGEIGLEKDTRGWQFDYPNVHEFANIDLSDRTLIHSNGQINFQGKNINFASGSGILDFNQLSQTKSRISLYASKAINFDAGLLVTQVGLSSNSSEQAIANAGGDIILEAPQVSIGNGAIISAGTLSQGAGGSITINAPEQVKLFSEKDYNPSIVSTSTGGIGQGGYVEINTGELVIQDGSQIQALAGQGSGGTITVNASEFVSLFGQGILRSQDAQNNTSQTKLASGLAASSGVDGLPLAKQPQGASGSLMINTPQLIIDQGAEISVSNYGLANAGDIKIATSTLSLNNEGQILANTASGKGGSIEIIADSQSDSLVILEYGSSISTTAAHNGNGGNITVETDNLAVVISSHISADANQGKGGNIFLDTQGLYLDSTSEITASSEVEQKQGNVAIYTLDLNSLATDGMKRPPLINQDQIVSSCGVGIDSQSNQIRDLGRGGIPDNPLRELAYLETINDWGVDQVEFSTTHLNQLSSVSKPVSQPQQIVEVNAWVINSQGNVELVANSPKQVSPTHCQVN